MCFKSIFFFKCKKDSVSNLEFKICFSSWTKGSFCLNQPLLQQSTISSWLVLDFWNVFTVVLIYIQLTTSQKANKLACAAFAKFFATLILFYPFVSVKSIYITLFGIYALYCRDQGRINILQNIKEDKIIFGLRCI